MEDPTGLDTMRLLGEFKEASKLNKKRTSQARKPAISIKGDKVTSGGAKAEKKKYDNAKTPNNEPLPQVAQAVTWLGTVPENKLSEIMDFSFGLIWKEIEAEVQELEGVERGFGAGAESLGVGPKGIEDAGSVLAMIRGKSAQGRWSGKAQAE